MRISNWVWLTVLGFGGCSFLLHSEQRQCNADADCRVFSQTATCAANVCVEPELPDSGSSQDAAVPFDAGVVDAGPAMGPPGCFSGTPKTDVEFFNSCTEASYLSFDNCARAGLCDGGAEVAIAKPDAGPAAPSTPLDGGPTESCYDATARPNVIYMNGSTNFTPFIRAMVPLVANNGFVIVWQPTSSCTGADTAFNPDPAKRVMKNPTTTSQTAASYYTTSNLPGGTPCLLGNGPNAPAPNQEYVDIGQSDIFATSCPQTSGASPFSTYVPDQDPYAMVHHYEGAAQAMAIVVPASSSQKAISAEAARMVFGAGGLAPWVDPSRMWVRSATTGTTGIIARGIGVPSTDWWGIDQRTAPNMVTQLKSVSTGEAERTIGTLSIDFADKEKDNIHILYFQPRGALAGFLPDRHPYTRDKQNVRDGHYPLWGPIHLYAREVNGEITAGAKAFITQFAVPRPSTDLLNAIIDTGNVPSCAMRVWRDAEMGPLRHFEAPFQCHCFYEKKLNGGNDCKACTGPADCGGDRPACNLGYCEVQ